MLNSAPLLYGAAYSKKRCLAERRLRWAACVGTLKDDHVACVRPDVNEEKLAMLNARQTDFTGKPLKGFVFVSIKGLTGAALEKWIDICIQYISTLKSKRPSQRNIKRSR